MWGGLPVVAVAVLVGLGHSAALGAGHALPRAPATATPVRLSPEWRGRLASALAQHRNGDAKAAARDFADIAAAPTPIPEYALLLQAEALSRLGDPAGAREVALRAAEKAGNGPLLDDALLLAAREAARAGDDAGAALHYRRFLDRYPEHPESAGARYALAQALLATGRPAEGLRLLRAIWIGAPGSPQADPAQKQERLLADRGAVVLPVTTRERLDRAERLLAAGLAGTARAEAEALLRDGAAGDTVLRALRVVAEAARRTGRAEEALGAVDRALSLADAARRPPWLLERARLLQRSRPAAIAALDLLVRNHPQSPEAPEALLLKAQLLEAASLPAEAEAVYRRLAAEYPEADEAGRALWRLGWLAWLRGSLEEAALRWGRLAAVRGGSNYREAGGYWMGRAREERGDMDEASRQWAALAASAPRSYYGLLASRRMTRRPVTAPTEGAPRALSFPADPLDPLRGEPRYAKVEALRAVGLSAWADGEMEELARRAAGEPVRLFAISAAYVEDARYHLALRILRRDFLGLARAGHPWLPRAFWEMFYPLGWRTELTGAASRAALDPLFVAAVVREESSFNPRARSRVGARGLMQLMPETARPMARQRGLAFQGGEVLEEPGPNLELGTAFLAGLVREFREPRLAIAAYNAGPTRVREWWATRHGDDIDVWVEHIPFNETRAFVKRVTVSWEEYRRLYGPPAGD
ncbi:MAG: transglycosylase SLT domain-containing protein [Candidatus Rokubacteria bacterium]|nr:transglycosylase SLT domain-containing protein [Candidatus Rokubacteria bacterium]